MTKSTITRERIQRIIRAINSEAYDEEEIREWLSSDEIMELSRMALAAMDGEPDCNERNLFCSTDTARMRKVISVSAGIEGAPLYRHAQPALVIPDEMTAEQAYEIGYYYGDPVNVFARGANWMRQHIIDSTLAAAQHDTPALNSVQSVVTVPGKWIPVSERMPEDEQEVLTINKMGHRFVSFFDKHSGLFFDRLDAPAACCIERVLVTHWMPLPAAPQEVKP
ncbi:MULTISPECIES: DUF551 domain-containing protein [Klebsiella pneumoniae complex]|uniref:DUF551 domain-containing protein n=1 Tax=Klebsiella pneumoniae complex TaxID=3390273 RepID=UPI0007CC8205|nr:MULTISPECIES: DUF551 domain-containing protein [Klebsiella]HBT5887980.1 DUF551 domain-containing protein [Klebsiella quasipneumoniae]ELA2523412.1 DUF551 domain-containing protein [Klebsiella pneumoniae]MCS4376999.1 DUF551 domain-containing protein [Klebsiella quasipneumoniae subsp. similipneumoniae]MCS4420444.1 DUF551 domain-containing protein [Klebsiella quasipneumoniae subsp. similipneumoniae]SAW20641.1 Eaa1 [Klebsiella pneumoniae]